MSALRRLAAEDLLAGSAGMHDVVIPGRALDPGVENGSATVEAGTVRLRPLTIGALVIVSRAARDDPGLVPLLMIKESLVDPPMSLEQLRALNAGLVHFLVSAVNRISGLSPDGDVIDGAIDSPIGQVHLLLARHFGWTPSQVAQLTPGQVAAYLAGVDALLRERADTGQAR